MKIVCFSTKSYEQAVFEPMSDALTDEWQFISQRLTHSTVSLAEGALAVCCFVTDVLDAAVLAGLHAKGVRIIALRSAGFDHVDLPAALELGLTVVRVPAYSPEAVAEFAVGMLLSLRRHIFQAFNRVCAHNFSLEGQVGPNLHGHTVGLVGTGKIGLAFARIMRGFGCVLLACDPVQSEEAKKMGITYVGQDELFKQAEIISLHCPLNEVTQHLINTSSLALMQEGVTLINTGRGGLVDTKAVIAALGSGKIGALGLDVYEFEAPLFFEDHSSETLEDALFLKLQSFDNVLITGHQAYLTDEALHNIATTTIGNIQAYVSGNPSNVVRCN